MRILKLLIENGASFDFKALDDVTALTYAVTYKQKEMAEFLIENGTNVNSNCSNLETPRWAHELFLGATAPQMVRYHYQMVYTIYSNTFSLIL